MQNALPISVFVVNNNWNVRPTPHPCLMWQHSFINRKPGPRSVPPPFTSFKLISIPSISARSKGQQKTNYPWFQSLVIFCISQKNQNRMLAHISASHFVNRIPRSPSSFLLLFNCRFLFYYSYLIRPLVLGWCRAEDPSLPLSMYRIISFMDIYGWRYGMILRGCVCWRICMMLEPVKLKVNENTSAFGVIDPFRSKSFSNNTNQWA